MNTTTPEEWRPISGYEGLYEVSNLGRVRSFKSGTARIMKFAVNKEEYLHLKLTAPGGRQINKTAHHLVLEAFTGPRPAGYECRHLDSNPGNNELSNLAWGTKIENAKDVLDIGHNHSANKTHCPRGHLLTAPNLRGNKRKLGERECLACHKARNYVYKHPGVDMQEESDRRYSIIMGL